MQSDSAFSCERIFAPPLFLATCSGYQRLIVELARHLPIFTRFACKIIALADAENSHSLDNPPSNSSVKIALRNRQVECEDSYRQKRSPDQTWEANRVTPRDKSQASEMLSVEADDSFTMSQ